MGDTFKLDRILVCGKILKEFYLIAPLSIVFTAL